MTYLISDLVSQDDETKIASSNLKIRIDKNEAIGYRTPGWPKNMTEVLGLVQLPRGKMVELNFLTTSNTSRINECQHGLEQLYPVIASAICKHFEFSPQHFDTSMANPSQEIRFQDFGKDTLTPREMSIVKLILTGHSSKSIALILGISLPTVKTHRRNIYNKFQISSQAELFNLFVRHLMENTV
jgi:DNA-binding CsgD family transcriptional regulator